MKCLDPFCMTTIIFFALCEYNDVLEPKRAKAEQISSATFKCQQMDNLISTWLLQKKKKKLIKL